jgi:hypothetical protein
VAGFSTAFTSESIDITTARRLPDLPGEAVLIQADPLNTANVLLQLGSAGVGHELAPSRAFTAELDNANLVWLASADGTTPVRVTFTVFGCGPDS